MIVQGLPAIFIAATSTQVVAVFAALTTRPEIFSTDSIIEKVKDYVKGSLLIVSLSYSYVAQCTFEVLSGCRRLSILRVAYTWNRHAVPIVSGVSTGVGRPSISVSPV